MHYVWQQKSRMQTFVRVDTDGVEATLLLMMPHYNLLPFIPS